MVGLFDLWDGLRTLLISSAGIYAVASYAKGSPYMPWIGFIFVMGHLSINQLRRQLKNDPSVIDITGAQMVLVMKLSAFCWNVADGAIPEVKLSTFQKDRRLEKLPSILDYTGYVLFFPSLLVGPAFDFAEYRRYIDCTMFDVPTTVDPAKKPPTRRNRKIPRSAIPALMKGASGLFWIFAFLQLGKFFYPSLLLSRKYSEYGFLRRIFTLHMVGFTTRTKYYGVWSLTEGACILSGLGFNGMDLKTGKICWDRVRNINPWRVESAQNTRAYLSSWNMNTNSWLRNYVYLRVTPMGRKPGFRASMATFITSAFWHGFYPGYYLSFVLASFIQNTAKNFRRYVRPFFVEPLYEKSEQKPKYKKKLYDIFSWLATQLTFSFVVAPFMVLGFVDSIRVWTSVYMYAVIGTMISIIFFATPAKALLAKKIQARDARAATRVRHSEQLVRNASTDSITGDRLPVLGVVDDPQKELDEAVKEIKAELEDLVNSGRLGPEGLGSIMGKVDTLREYENKKFQGTL